ncbi:MAG: prephenate dehydrogenase/arogenate dehydrogenase family protein, partial [Candidatus Syntropharchaeia archaeon]
MKIAIVGGAGAMGQWFARFFRNNGEEVVIIDVNQRTKEIAEEIGVFHGEEKDLRDADVVMVSVPIDSTIGVIEKIAPEIHPGSLVMDITSVKRGVVNAMSRLAPDETEILSIHPMFGPTMPDMRGQTIIVIPVRKGEISERMIDLFKNNGARIEVTTPEEHDETMAVIQGLTHFVHIVFGM